MSFSVHHWQKRYELVRRGSGSRACLPLNRNRLSQRPQWRILLVLLTCLDVLNATFIGFRVPLRELERISLWRMSMQIISYQMFLEYLRSRLLPTYLPTYLSMQRTIYLLSLLLLVAEDQIPKRELIIETRRTRRRSEALLRLNPLSQFVLSLIFFLLLSCMTNRNQNPLEKTIKGWRRVHQRRTQCDQML